MTILKNRSLLLPATEEDRRRRRSEKEEEEEEGRRRRRRKKKKKKKKEEEEEGRRRNQLTALKRVVSVVAATETDPRRSNDENFETESQPTATHQALHCTKHTVTAQYSTLTPQAASKSTSLPH